MEEIQIHPTEMSQGENGSDEEALQRLTSTIVQKIGEKTKSFFYSPYIYRVPEYLRKHKESAYTPRLIAIGPLHREDKHLQTPFQHVKMSYTNNLLSRLTAGMEELESAEKTKFTVVQECLAEMKTLVDYAKKCYAEEVTLDEEMMLVDGCFILEFFYGYRTLTVPQTDPIFDAFAFDKVGNDLVLLENQIPLFVLEKLFRLTVDRIPNRPDTNYVRWFYGHSMLPVRNSNNNGSAKSSWVSGSTAASEAEEEEELYHIDDHHTANYYHILHNIHDGYLPRYQREKYIDFRGMPSAMPSASELVYAGVKFVPNAGNDLFKFKFSEPKGLFSWCRRARFEIPPLRIDDSTESYLRNLIALEQSCPSVSLHVSSYAWLMDILVNSDKDIHALEEAGVLRNYLGGVAEDAADLFNNLCKEIVAGEYFLHTYREATDHSKRFWPKNMAHVKRTYFASPWTFIAFCVGFIVFIMTVLQFVHDFFNKSG